MTQSAATYLLVKGMLANRAVMKNNLHKFISPFKK